MYYSILTVGFTLLKKHYDNLWMSLPEDIMITLGQLCKFENFKTNDRFLNLITSCPDYKQSNKMILYGLMYNARNVFRLLGLSYLMEKLVASPTNATVIESFRNG